MLAAVWLPVWKKTVSEPEGGERIRQEKRRTQSAGINETESDATSDLPEPDDRSPSVDEAVEQTEPETLDDDYYKHVDEILKDVFDDDPK